MKYMFSVMVFSCLFFCMNINAGQYYEVVQKYSKKFGEYLENVENVPLVGKLTNILPLALAVTSLKEYPGQTIIMVALLAGYFLVRSEAMRCALYKHNVRCKKVCESPQVVELDDSFFEFEDDSEKVMR